MNENEIEAVAAILVRWNPLGEEAKNIADLDGYRTEAIDIISVLAFLGARAIPEKVVADVLNQGFGLTLKAQGCVAPAQQILSVLNLKP